MERVRQQRIAKEIAAIEADPLNPQTHLELAKRHMGKSGNHLIALAQIKTATLLGGDAWAKECETWTSQLEMPNVDLLPHNSYFRYKSLVEEIIKTADGKPASVLGVGGGYGQ